MRSLIGSMVMVALLSASVLAPAAEEVTRTFSAPADRVWGATEAVLKQLGWEIEKADRAIGWITTRSKSVEGEEYGVYAKGTRHRLRFVIKDAGAGRTNVAVERTVFKRERILFVEKDEPITTTDRTVERDMLSAIAKAL